MKKNNLEYEYEENNNLDLFKVGDFEGPLDLLLFLIKSKKMDILEVNLLSISDQYVNIVLHNVDLDLDQASEYFLIASKLISIKSKSLLNQKMEEEEIIDSDEENLIESLIKYEKIKLASKEITKIFEEVSIIDKIDNDLDSFLHKNKNVEEIIFKNNQEELSNVMQSLINKVFQENKKRNIPTIKRREYSIEKEMNIILDFLNQDKKIYFSNLIKNKPSIHIAIIFLSILELASKKVINTKISNNDILITLKE